MNVFTEELLRPGQRLTDVTMNTRKRLAESSAMCQLAQDEVRCTLCLVVDLQSCQDVGPARNPSATTFRVSKEEDLCDFQVREEEMGKLRRWLEDRAEDFPDRMLVHGMGGTGKTIMCKIIAARAAAEGVREAVLFLTLSNGSCVEEYMELAKKLGATEEIAESLTEQNLRAYVHGLLSSE